MWLNQAQGGNKKALSPFIDYTPYYIYCLYIRWCFYQHHFVIYTVILFSCGTPFGIRLNEVIDRFELCSLASYDFIGFELTFVLSARIKFVFLTFCAEMKCSFFIYLFIYLFLVGDLCSFGARGIISTSLLELQITERMNIIL